MSEHIHELTGPGLTCACGFAFNVARFQVTIEVYDNHTKRSITRRFATGIPNVVADSLHQALESFEESIRHDE